MSAFNEYESFKIDNERLKAIINEQRDKVLKLESQLEERN